MHHRISIVPFVDVNSLSYSSVLEIGDAFKINAFSRAIAVQREYPLFLEGEAKFTSYRIFSEDIPIPAIQQNVRSSFIHDNPVIHVKSVTLTGGSNASVVQIGSTHEIRAEARVKHIRQLLQEDDNGGNS